MKDAAKLDKCGEFPTVRAVLGIGAGVALERGRLFIVLPYETPIADVVLAERMAHLCSFYQAA